MRRILLSLPFVLLGPLLALPALAGNWGENWGSMVWGSAAALPSLEGVGVWLLVVSLLGVAAWRLRRRVTPAGLMLVLVLLVPLLMAPHYTNWHAFTNGQVADAVQVNQNFVLAAAALDDFEARVSALEAAANTNTQLTNAEVAAAAIAEGFVTGPHTTRLTEGEVDVFVADNGFGLETEVLANANEIAALGSVVVATSGTAPYGAITLQDTTDFVTTPLAVQILTNANTIISSEACVKVAAASDVLGATLSTVDAIDGQHLTVINESPDAHVVFAVTAISSVAGAGSMRPLQAYHFVYNASLALWFPIASLSP